MNTPSDTILVVDDTPANLAILFTGLRNAGYKVLINERGDVALQTAAYTLPDLIIRHHQDLVIYYFCTI